MGEIQARVAERAKIHSELRRFLLFLLGILLALVAYYGPFAPTETASRALGVTIFMLVMFITEAIPMGVTGLLGCWLFWTWARIPVAKAFSGFVVDTPWFVLGAVLMGLMAETTGLARRLAFNIISRLGSDYSRILLGMMVVNFLLTFLVPSGVAKTTILCAIAIGMIESYGMGKGSNIGKGLILAMTYLSGLFDKTIIAGAATILARGLIEQFGKVQVLWGLWLIAFLPIALINIGASWYFILKLFPPERKVLDGGEEYCRLELRKMGPMTADEIRAMVILLLATAFWATDFLHHINASIIGLGAGLFGCLPLVGVLKREDFAKANYPVIIFTGGAITLGIVMADTGILKTLAAAMFKWMTPIMHSAAVPAGMFLYWYANLFHLFLANETSMVSATMPALMDLAIKNGFNPLTLGMIWGFAVEGKVFVYQSGTLVVGYAFGYFTTKDLFKFGLALFILESLLILAIIPVYWPLLGLTYR